MSEYLLESIYVNIILKIQYYKKATYRVEETRRLLGKKKNSSFVFIVESVLHI